MLLANSPKLLDKAIDVLLNILVPAFANMHLTINWQPGKTEALLKYRGNSAVQCREQRRQQDGKLAIPVPGYDGQAISIVGVYRYLGTFLDAAGETFRNTQHCVQKACTAYSPLAVKLYGSNLIPIPHRLAFMRSLVLSRLLFNVQTSVLKQRDMQALNGIYMRVL